jgi:hypothetical protein
MATENARLKARVAQLEGGLAMLAVGDVPGDKGSDLMDSWAAMTEYAGQLLEGKVEL